MASPFFVLILSADDAIIIKWRRRRDLFVMAHASSSIHRNRALDADGIFHSDIDDNRLAHYSSYFLVMIGVVMLRL